MATYLFAAFDAAMLLAAIVLIALVIGGNRE
jgi:hypothetical protein